MENAALLVLLESVLGKGNSTSKGNYSFKCPFCTHHKPKLEINLNTTAKKENFWHCWVCNSRGKTIKSLFKAIKVSEDKFKDLNLLITPIFKETLPEEILALPGEFISLNNIPSDRITQIEAKHALKFLKKRNLTQEDIIKYNIGFCKEGKYEGRIIIPSYDADGKLNYFTARDYKETAVNKYKNPAVSRDIVAFELYINWNAPIILCEGMFDAVTIKRNVIPLLGKTLSDSLMKKIVQSSVDRIYIALDNDARKDALKHVDKLISFGKEVYLVELDGKDANEIGFERFLNIVEQTQPLTFQTLLEKKLQNI
jgi:DNA primase